MEKSQKEIQFSKHGGKIILAGVLGIVITYAIFSLFSCDIANYQESIGVTSKLHWYNNFWNKC
tara:strand:- start:94 stop:282 length:189 start_codon:yes stop_codon:yes gene_type:complete